MPMIRLGFRAVAVVILVAGPILAAGLLDALWTTSAAAQDSRDGLFGGLFNRGDRQSGGRQPEPAGQASEADLIVRLDRIENALRQITGAVEQLQYRNQQLEQQVRQMQEGAGVRS